MPHECTECGKGFPDGSKEMLGGCPSCGGKKFQYIPHAGAKSGENRAQASARREVVDGDELPTADPPSDTEEEVTEAPPTDLATLRERLDSQFESIRIVEPGQYELNLMELYDRDTYVISLQEDGRYVIDVPEAWRSASPES